MNEDEVVILIKRIIFGVCSLCKLVILDIAVVTGDQSFHQECFACEVCGDLLDVKMFYQLEDKFFCEKDKEVPSSTIDALNMIFFRLVLISVQIVVNSSLKDL